MRKLLRFFMAVVGLGTGCGIVALVLFTIKFPGYDYVMRYTTDTNALIAIYVVTGFLFGLIFYIMSPRVMDGVQGFFTKIENKLREMPAIDILFGVCGLILGLLLAFLIGLIVANIQIPVLPQAITVLLYILCGYLGCKIGVTRRQELMDSASGRRSRATSAGGLDAARAKVLDTSAIIDGRIYDICKTGFVEGALIVPAFVLKELRHIADSSDTMKRNRGRRGLDIIKEMQTTLSQSVIVEERDYEDVDEVDLKLIRLAGDVGGVLVTTDFNLNKVASVQNIPVLNINELAGAIRPILLPGEELRLSIVREGKEPGQGVGYLDDGTMVIVDGGRRRIGETVDLIVTSALQTAAGRMIFARLQC